MANQFSRSPGDLERVTSQAAIGDVPDFGVDTGAAARVLANVGNNLSGVLGKMADHAAASEGELEGMNAGAAAGARFVQKATADASATKRPGKPPPAPPAGGATDGLSDTPLQLRHDNTIRGDAFDAAAVRSYGWRFKAGLSTDLAQAEKDNADSPGGYEAAVKTVADTYRGDITAPELREIFDQTLAEQIAPARLAIAARHEAKLKAQAKEAAEQGSDAERATLERNAYALGANPAADWMLAPAIERAVKAIDNEPSFTPAEKVKRKKALETTVLAARTQGTFDALPTPSGKQEFALSILDDYAKGKGPYASLSLSEAKELSSSLYQQATAAQTRLTAEQKGEKAKLEGLVADDVASIAGSGQGLDPVKAGLTPDRVEQLLGQEGLVKWQADRATARQSWEATAGMEAETPAELEQRLVAIKPKPGQENYADLQKIYLAAQKHRDEILEERKTDPLGQANRGGLVELKAVDTTTPEGLVSSLSLRAQQAKQVSQAYGTPLTVFRPEEKATLTNALRENPTLLPAFARGVELAMGDAAPKALAEISDAGPEVAHAAGLSLATGDNSVADDVARTLSARKAGDFKAKMPTDNVLGDAAGAILGDALSQNDAARGAVLGTANLLFEKDANALGFDPSSVNKPGSAAAQAYERAIDRALGSRVVDGVKYGGLAEVNGASIVAPSFMPADQPQRLMSGIRDTDLTFLPPIASANGVPVSAAQLRQAHLVTVGDGLYRVALGDPQSFDPQYVAAEGGGFWTLDMKQLQQLQGLSEFNRDELFPLGKDPLDLIRSLRTRTSAP